jgi:hypothetical protein
MVDRPRRVRNTLLTLQQLEPRETPVVLTFTTSPPQVIPGGDAKEGVTMPGFSSFTNPSYQVPTGMVSRIVQAGTTSARFQTSLNAGFGSGVTTPRWDYSSGNAQLSGTLEVRIDPSAGERVGSLDTSRQRRK